MRGQISILMRLLRVSPGEASCAKLLDSAATATRRGLAVDERTIQRDLADRRSCRRNMKDGSKWMISAQSQAMWADHLGHLRQTAPQRSERGFIGLTTLTVERVP